jgi:hypothetical protein
MQEMIVRRTLSLTRTNHVRVDVLSYFSPFVDVTIFDLDDLSEA